MKGVPNMGNILKQAQQFQAKIAKLQEELGDRSVEASSGGGMVTVVANGRQEILSITIDPEVIDPDDVAGVAAHDPLLRAEVLGRRDGVTQLVGLRECSAGK